MQFSCYLFPIRRLHVAAISDFSRDRFLRGLAQLALDLGGPRK